MAATGGNVFLQTYGKEIISLAVPLIAWALNTFFKAKAKLLIANPHSFTFLVQEPLRDPNGDVIRPTQTIQTRSFVLFNSGRDTATNVEVIFNWKPKCVNLWPTRHFDDRTDSEGRYAMMFKSLAPRENLGFEMFSINSDAPEIMVARCDQCAATFINMSPQPIVPAWKRRIAILLMFAGLSTVIYLAILLLQFLIIRTPYGVG